MPTLVFASISEPSNALPESTKNAIDQRARNGCSNSKLPVASDEPPMTLPSASTGPSSSNA
jgi:hypothetical protein